MFEVSVEETFSAGHALRGYKGKCENPHGHNYRVRVSLVGEELDKIGLLYDFTALKQAMKQAIEQLDHKFLNDLPPFESVNPSAENLARWFYDRAAERLPAGNGIRVDAVTVWETDTTAATFRPSS
jgi:6-pyruvoyltetrahydropterin/6-carboxytetrahydropterin synthase